LVTPLVMPRVLQERAGRVEQERAGRVCRSERDAFGGFVLGVRGVWRQAFAAAALGAPAKAVAAACVAPRLVRACCRRVPVEQTETALADQDKTKTVLLPRIVVSGFLSKPHSFAVTALLRDNRPDQRVVFCGIFWYCDVVMGTPEDCARVCKDLHGWGFSLFW